MGYYDYREYFYTLVTSSEDIIKNQQDIIVILSVLTFMFAIFLVYYFIRNMIRGG